MSSNEKFERDLAAFLTEEDSRLAALYRNLPQTEPDPRLDAAVRAMAHRALNPELVATPQAASARRWGGRWLPALGAAAGVVLAAGVAFRLGPSWHRERGETGAPAVDVISVRPIEAPPAARAAPGKLQPQPAPEATVGKTAAKREDSTDNRPAAEASGASGRAAGQPAAAGGPQPQAFSAPAQKRAPEIDVVEHKEAVAAGASQNLHERDAGAAAGKRLAQPPVGDKEAAVHAKAAEPARPDELRSATPAAPALAPAATIARPAASGATVEQSASAPPASAPVPSAAPKADTGEGLSREQQAEPAAFDKSVQQQNDKVRSRDPNASLYPEHWLQNIRVMLRDGNRDDALRSLAEFRRMYPDYHLPDDLRDLK